MSEPEGFLTRWSRRKREAEETAPATPPSASEERALPTPTDQDDVIESRAGEPRDTQAKPPEVDLSALPSLDSITATTDIRPFLLPGVPAELTRAALRRVWAADPTIRDFVGLAENAWDFTAPETIPGFGPSVPPDVARRLLAGMMGDNDSAAAAEPVARAETETKPNVSATEDTNREASATVEHAVGDPARGDDHSGTVDVAMHKEEATPRDPPKSGRGHGGALPR
jgi:Protein of unknown function (DUF3306)